jgi:hypothetical protein
LLAIWHSKYRLCLHPKSGVVLFISICIVQHGEGFQWRARPRNDCNFQNAPFGISFFLVLVLASGLGILSSNHLLFSPRSGLHIHYKRHGGWLEGRIC